MMKKFLFCMFTALSVGIYAGVSKAEELTINAKSVENYLTKVKMIVGKEDEKNKRYDQTQLMIGNRIFPFITTMDFYQGIGQQFVQCEIDIKSLGGSQRHADACKENVISGLQRWISLAKNTRIDTRAFYETVNQASFMGDGGITIIDYQAWSYFISRRHMEVGGR